MGIWDTFLAAVGFLQREKHGEMLQQSLDLSRSSTASQQVMIDQTEKMIKLTQRIETLTVVLAVLAFFQIILTAVTVFKMFAG